MLITLITSTCLPAGKVKVQTIFSLIRRCTIIDPAHDGINLLLRERIIGRGRHVAVNHLCTDARSIIMNDLKSSQHWKLTSIVTTADGTIGLQDIEDLIKTNT